MKWTERKRMEKRLRAQRFYESEIGRAVKAKQKKYREANNGAWYERARARRGEIKGRVSEYERKVSRHG